MSDQAKTRSEDAQIALLNIINQTPILSFLGVGVYIFFTVASTTDAMLVLNSAVALPLLNVQVPIGGVLGFYIIAPFLILILHAYLLLHLYIKVDLGRVELSRLDDLLLRSTLSFILVFFPLFILLCIQIRFIPYHAKLTTWLHTLVIGADIALILACLSASKFRRRIAMSPTPIQSSSIDNLLSHPVLLLVCGASLALSLTAAITVSKDQDNSDGWLSEWRNLNLRENVLTVNELRPELINILREGDIKQKENALIQISPLNYLQGKDMNYANLFNAIMPRLDLRAANNGQQPSRLQGAVLEWAQMQRALLDRAEMKYASLRNAQLQHASLVDTHLEGAQLGDSRLQAAVLRGAYLQGANLENAQLQGVNLQNSHLQGANLYKSNLQGADLRGAQLQGANLSHADLRGANLGKINLQAVDLRGAQLQGAILRNATLNAIERDEKTNLELADITSTQSGALNKEEIDKVIAELQRIDSKRQSGDIEEKGPAPSMPLEEQARLKEKINGLLPARIKALETAISTAPTPLESIYKRCYDEKNNPLCLYSSDKAKAVEYSKELNERLAELACADGYVARGLITQVTDANSGRLDRKSLAAIFLQKVRESDSKCRGLGDLPDNLKNDLTAIAESGQ